jgi:starvation-inducible DNA-binding protein
MTLARELTYEPQIGISTENRANTITILNRTVADEHLLYTRLRNFHWNVTGVHFQTFHELFEEQYEAVKLIADEVAERVRMLGGYAIGTLGEFLDAGTLEETPDDYPSAETMVRNLVEAHEHIIKNLRDDIAECAEEYGDEGSADLLTGVMRQHEEMAWMLRSTLNN